MAASRRAGLSMGRGLELSSSLLTEADYPAFFSLLSIVEKEKVSAGWLS
jgi:hypothetical protein